MNSLSDVISRADVFGGKQWGPCGLSEACLLDGADLSGSKSFWRAVQVGTSFTRCNLKRLDLATSSNSLVQAFSKDEY